jgi:outer membrane protein assembly factor BamB
VNGLQLLYKYKADNRSRGMYSLTAPIVNGFLITYLGFKEMLVFAGSDDNVYSVDADLNRLIWKTHFDYKGGKPQSKASTVTCPGGLTASAAMAGSASAVFSFGRKPPKKGKKSPVGGSGFGSLGAFFAVSSDGYLHTLNTSTGGDLIPPVQLVPPNSNVRSLNVEDNVVYAATVGDCGGAPNALYAVDVSEENKKAVSFATNGSGISGVGPAVGTDGTVYAQIASGHGDLAGEYHDTVLALSGADLKVKDYFTPSGDAAASKSWAHAGVTPLIFSWKGKDVVVAGASDGRLYLLHADSLGGAGHHTPAFRTEPIASTDKGGEGHGFRGAFSSWFDSDSGTRWVYASLSGPPNPAFKFPIENGDASKGSVVAFKVEEKDGQTMLTPAWISASVPSPAPVVTANGVVFALATGTPASTVRPDGKPYAAAALQKASTRATLYALDAATGKQLYSSGTTVSGHAAGSGLAVANGRIYFATSDNTVYCFGFLKEHPQLTEQ